MAVGFLRERAARRRDPRPRRQAGDKSNVDITISTSISEAEFGLTMTDGIAIADAVGDGVPALS